MSGAAFVTQLMPVADQLYQHRISVAISVKPHVVVAEGLTSWASEANRMEKSIRGALTTVRLPRQLCRCLDIIIVVGSDGFLEAEHQTVANAADLWTIHAIAA